MAGAIGGVASAVGGGIAAAKMAKALKKIARMQIASTERLAEASAGEREQYSQMSQGYQNIASQNLLASEEAKSMLMSALGTPGTYGGRDTGGAITLGNLTPMGLDGVAGGGGGSSLLSSGRLIESGTVDRDDVAIGGGSKGSKWTGKRSWEVSGLGLDAQKMADAAKNTAGFRAVSGMVAEAEQLQNREGKLWNQLNNSIVGGIYESSAAMHKQQMEQIAKNMAQGGSARRMGLQMAQVMQVQEGINRSRTSSLWQAKAGLEQYRADRVTEVTNFSQDWVNNQAGIQDAFVANLNQIQMHWAKTLPPTLISASLGAQNMAQQGILDASQGMMTALQTKNDGIMGMIDSISGLGKIAMGTIMGDGLLASGAPSTQQALANAPWNE